MDAVIAEEIEQLCEYRSQFHHAAPPPLDGKSVLLIDDGLAIGATAEAAVLSARQQKASRVVVAAPVALPGAVERLRRAADDVVVLLADNDFEAVCQYYYDQFSQTTDDEVLGLLSTAAERISSQKRDE